ncbi:ImmA/IrrE family metallo-endopeptidase [Microbacterium sp. SS28]|uniref:ImmA/IrrE family metallo-endopeptidase n=1 Tax=Microbacterium sp. SS28 TaxID=2919948 RepID=UPI001FAA69EA|nr:ImmA/IrrE family metallo-endopeptidase [Microbacterium sp. SS28]
MKRINKAACKRLAGEVRAELSLGLMDPLDPWQLAEEYGVTVMALGDLPLDHHIREHFHSVRAEVFSGALLPHRTGAVIIENDAHPLARRRSTMGHEMAHVVGEHKFGTSLVNERGCRTADKFQEDEAAEISGELLIPSDAAKRLARQRATDDDVAQLFGVSTEFARWRMNATGARIIAQRAAAYR